MSQPKAPDLVLASASPRRRQLLEQIGVRSLVCAADIDESPLAHEAASAYVIRMAKQKSEQVRLLLGAPQLPLLSADTIVVVDGNILGKPTSKSEAKAMLRQLSGRSHQVLTSVLLWGQQQQQILQQSTVTFRLIDNHEMDAYWASGEPKDKAAGYAIQGLGAVFVQNLEGSYSGVMGLPLFETARLLANEQIFCWPQIALSSS